jgi:hypothetical protein
MSTVRRDPVVEFKVLAEERLAWSSDVATWGLDGSGRRGRRKPKKTVHGGEADEGSTEGRTKTVWQTGQTLPSSCSKKIDGRNSSLRTANRAFVGASN